MTNRRPRTSAERRQVRSRPGDGGRLAIAALARARDYIDQHLACPLRLEGAARAAGLSRYHFSRCFSASMGESFVGYVARRRVEEAKRALDCDPRLGLAALAVELGFCDQAHFSNVFRRIAGTTPRRYANRPAQSGGSAGFA